VNGRQGFRPGLISAPLLALALALGACSSGGIRAGAPSTSSTTSSNGLGVGASTTAARTSTVDLARVSLTLGDQSNLLQSLLVASGQLSDAPYKITWSEFASGAPLMEAMRAGAVDGGVTGDTSPVIEEAAGTKLKIVGAIHSTGSGMAIVLPKQSTISSVRGLQGKSVALAVGSSVETFLAQALEKNGMTLRDVHLVNLQPGDALAAFTSGQVDAWASFDPYTALAQFEGAKTLVTAPEVGNAGLTFLTLRAAVMDDAGKVAALADLLGRLVRATQWQATHHPFWVAKLVALTHLPQAVAETTLHRGDATYQPIDATVKREEQAVADLLFREGVITKRIDIAASLDSRYNAAVTSALPNGASTG
jgi:sulfonate transport system substrate-binding protein